MKIFIKQNPWADCFDIYIAEQDERGRQFLAKPMNLEFVEHDFNKQYEPSIKIQRFFGRETNFLQALSDALAVAGYEPKTVEENKGELKATKYHLEDMRKMALKQGGKV